MIPNTLIDYHEDKGHGAHYFSPTGESVKINVVVFSDYCSGQVTLSSPDLGSLEDLKSHMERDAQGCRDLLHLSGGELLHIKCSYHVTHYKFTPAGAPILDPADSLSYIKNVLNGKAKTIKKLSPYTTHKTLGCHVSPSGNNCFTALKTKSTKLGKMIYLSDCNSRESRAFY